MTNDTSKAMTINPIYCFMVVWLTPFAKQCTMYHANKPFSFRDLCLQGRGALEKGHPAKPLLKRYYVGCNALVKDLERAYMTINLYYTGWTLTAKLKLRGIKQ